MRDKILSILREIEPEGDFENSPDFFEEELIDSFGVLTMITRLEKMFAINIPSKDITADNFMNLSCIEALLKNICKVG